MLEIKTNSLLIFSGLNELIEIYEDLDSHIETFKRETGIDCVKGCGKCCEIPSWKIETSILELMLPAIHLWETKEAEIFLEKILRIDKDSFCVFYSKNLYEKGCCYIYPLRPLICRLFGFSGMKDKFDQSIPILCSVIKKQNPDNIERIMKKIQMGLEIPINSYYAKRISLINPLYGRDLYGINEAARFAIEWIGYRLGLLNNQQEGARPTKPFERAA
jgi:Fe-S-cluster containining protein